MHDPALPDTDELALLTRLRRDLHRIPELDFDLPETTAYVRAELERVRDAVEARHGAGVCSVFSPCRSSLCMFFDRESEHATAVRADMDALPVAERSGVAFASCRQGRMHACGHDGHMAMALALAHHLADSFDELPRSVLLVFQPAEETTGGADFICESGVFERYRTDRIFGFHLWPDLPLGSIAGRPGPLLAQRARPRSPSSARRRISPRRQTAPIRSKQECASCWTATTSWLGRPSTSRACSNAASCRAARRAT